jgi:hypothetical protein
LMDFSSSAIRSAPGGFSAQVGHVSWGFHRIHMRISWDICDQQQLYTTIIYIYSKKWNTQGIQPTKMEDWREHGGLKQPKKRTQSPRNQEGRMKRWSLGGVTTKARLKHVDITII